METNPNSQNKIAMIFIAAITIILLIACSAGGYFLFKNKNKEENSKNMNDKNTTQNSNLKLTDRIVELETNFGTLRIEMLDEAAPKTTENFIRLSDKGYYNGLGFHRIAKGTGFNIIQGGDPNGNGSGGESAFGSAFDDEIFKEGTNQFLAPDLYSFNGDFAVYKKGYVAMANSGPNTNGSQFFVMLGDTYLDPAYTIFGKIDEKDFPILDKIASEVNPVSGNDNKPNKEIKIISAKVK